MYPLVLELEDFLGWTTRSLSRENACFLVLHLVKETFLNILRVNSESFENFPEEIAASCGVCHDHFIRLTLSLADQVVVSIILYKLSSIKNQKSVALLDYKVDVASVKYRFLLKIVLHNLFVGWLLLILAQLVEVLVDQDDVRVHVQ